MDRTLLYYPTFRFPSEQWLKDALLYWDQVGSIVPARFIDEVSRTDNYRLLDDKRLYKRFDPQPFIEDSRKASDFTQTFARRLESEAFIRELAREDSNQFFNIAFEKMTYDAWDILREKELTPDDFNSGEEIRVRKPAAVLYMGLLARYLASNEARVVVTSTTFAEYEDLVYHSSEDTHQDGYALTLFKSLPKVSPSTSLADLLNFRSRRRDELLRFRGVLDNYQSRISKTKSADEALRLITRLEEKLEIEVTRIRRLMREHKIGSVVGTLRAIFSAKAPYLAGASSAVVGGGAIGSIDAAVICSIPGFIAGASIEVAHYKLSMDKQLREIQESPYSYLYSAQKEHIT